MLISVGTVAEVQSMVFSVSGAVSGDESGGKSAPASWWGRTFFFLANLLGAMLFCAATLVPPILTLTAGWLWYESAILAGLLLTGSFLSFQCPRLWTNTAATLVVTGGLLKGRRFIPNPHDKKSLLHPFRNVIPWAGGVASTPAVEVPETSSPAPAEQLAPAGIPPDLGPPLP